MILPDESLTKIKILICKKKEKKKTGELICLERVRFGMHPSPHKIVIRIGRMHLVKSMGMAYLTYEFRICVHCFEG